jgi:AcrR family transcriptional regulator
MPDLADKRKAALDELTREEIRKAANRVIAAHGMVGMTVALVAEEAGLAKGTLYNYFEDKNDLIFYVIMKSFEPLVDRLEEVADADLPPVEQLARAVQTVLGGFAGQQHLITMAVQSRATVDPAKAMPEMQKMRARMERAFARIIKRGMDRGAYRPGDPDAVARLLIAAVNGLVHPRVFRATEGSVEEEAAHLVDVFLNGIAAPKKGKT